MVTKNKKGKDVQLANLLKNVFQDDLPPGVEERMKDLLVRFHEGIGRVEQGSFRKREDQRRRGFLAGSGEILEWAFPRKILALTSVFMVILGGFFHISGARPALADTLSLLNALVCLSDQVREVNAMECRLQITNPTGPHQQYLIRWQLPGMTRVDAFEDGQQQKTLWMEGTDIIVTDLVHPGLRKYYGLNKFDDPLFLPVVGFLNPEQIAVIIYKEWEPRVSSEGDTHQHRSYLCVDKKSKAPLEIVVDPNTHLPLIIRQFPSEPNTGRKGNETIRIFQFDWNKPVPPQLLVPPGRAGISPAGANNHSPLHDANVKDFQNTSGLEFKL